MNEQENLKEFENCISFDSGFIVENYPYGFKRTQIKYWVETKKNSQRFCSVTLNPKTNLWNKPKYSTYTDLILMFRQKETEHIKSYHFNLTYSDEEEFNKLLEFLGDYRNNYINNFLKLCSAVYETRKHIKVSVRARQFKNKVTGEIVESIPIFNLKDYEEVTDREQDERQKEVKKDINNLFVHNALKEGLSIGEIKNLK